MTRDKDEQDSSCWACRNLDAYWDSKRKAEAAAEPGGSTPSGEQQAESVRDTEEPAPAQPR